MVELRWQGRTGAPSALAERLQQAWGAPWRWHSLTRDTHDSGELTLHSPRTAGADAVAAPAASPLSGAEPLDAQRLPRSDQTEQLWPWVQAGAQAHGLQVLQLRPQAPAQGGSPAAANTRLDTEPAEAHLHLVLQGHWAQWRALRQALWQQAPGWRDVRWRVSPAPQASEQLHIDWQWRWPLRPADPSQALWQPPAWAPAPGRVDAQSPTMSAPPPEAMAWRDLGRWHEGPQVRALLQGPQGTGLWAVGQSLPHTPWRVQRITPQTVWLQGPHGPAWPLPPRETP